MEQELEPQIARLAAGVREQGFDFFDSDFYEKELAPELENERIAARVAAAIPVPPGVEAAAWEATVAGALDAADEGSKPEEAQFVDEFLGAHGARGSYFFKLTLSLPGLLLEHNAMEREGDRLTWRFSNREFLMRDRALRARSRPVHPGRIALAGAGAVLLLLFVFRAALRRGKA